MSDWSQEEVAPGVRRAPVVRIVSLVDVHAQPTHSPEALRIAQLEEEVEALGRRLQAKQIELTAANKRTARAEDAYMRLLDRTLDHQEDG
jgi:hypothetical protein